MRSLCLEHFFTSEVVLRTWRPTQTVAKCFPYRWSIQYLFVLRGANKMDFCFFKFTAMNIFVLCLHFCYYNCSWELLKFAHRWQVHKILKLVLTKLKSWKLITFFLHVKRAIFHNIFFYWNLIGQDIYPFNVSCYIMQSYILSPPCSYIGIIMYVCIITWTFERVYILTYRRSKN